MTEEEYIAKGDTAWKEQDWKRGLDSSAEAIALNPDSLAKEKRVMVMLIIRFFNKDMLNP